MKYHLKECGTSYRGCSPDCKFHEYHSDREVIERNKMKQVAYDFDWRNVIFSLLRDRNDVEDGYWRLDIATEVATPVLLQPMYQGQIPETLPGIITRITGLRVTKVLGPGPMTLRVRDGLVEVKDGSDTDQRGHEESGGGPGGDPGSIEAGF